MPDVAARSRRSPEGDPAGIADGSDRRSAHELELVRKQAEMKYLDETCRKELSVPVEELATGRESAGARRSRAGRC